VVLLSSGLLFLSIIRQETEPFRLQADKPINGSYSRKDAKFAKKNKELEHQK
jgi:hypothetical protein